jgi:APA family basic amino acid/polyamine antiporter
MAREAGLPRWLAAVHPRFKVPHRAELVLAAVICLIISITDGAIGFSSFRPYALIAGTGLGCFSEDASGRTPEAAGAGAAVREGKDFPNLNAATPSD